MSDNTVLINMLQEAITEADKMTNAPLRRMIRAKLLDFIQRLQPPAPQPSSSSSTPQPGPVATTALPSPKRSGCRGCSRNS